MHAPLDSNTPRVQRAASSFTMLWLAAGAAAVIAGECAFRLLDWTWLQLAMRDQVLAALSPFWSVEAGQAATYHVAQEFFEITARCTYADFLLTATPLLAVMLIRRGSVAQSTLWIGAWVLGILTINVLRILVSTHVHLAWGLGWWAAHDLPDYLIRAIGMFGLVAWWVSRACFAPRAAIDGPPTTKPAATA